MRSPAGQVGEAQAHPSGPTGLAFEPHGGVVWFNEYWVKKPGWLTRLDP